MTEIEKLEEEIKSLESKVEELESELEDAVKRRDELQECINEVYMSVRYYETK